MQKIATYIFIVASVTFGILGIILVHMIPNGAGGSEPPEWLTRSFMTTVFLILPSFALSVAGKYLMSGKKG